jgi:urease accessory protein
LTLPFIEPAIIASVLVLGLIISTFARLPLAAGALVAGAFAFAHGHAHGYEMPASAAGFAYGCGFLVATAVLEVLGFGIGRAARETKSARAFRYVGGAIVVGGLYLGIV